MFQLKNISQKLSKLVSVMERISPPLKSIYIPKEGSKFILDSKRKKLITISSKFNIKLSMLIGINTQKKYYLKILKTFLKTTHLITPYCGGQEVWVNHH